MEPPGVVNIERGARQLEGNAYRQADRPEHKDPIKPKIHQIIMAVHDRAEEEIPSSTGRKNFYYYGQLFLQTLLH